MNGKHAQAKFRLRVERQVDESENAGVGPPVNDGQLPEILVERDERPPLGVGPVENFLIAGIEQPVADMDGIVTGVSQRPLEPERVQESSRSFIARRRGR